ncbi:MAG TPA: hypothetical protein VF657_02280 [Actinoplanes sp.]|jgi:RNA polymerase sigma-70 factor (ECF subfamily)
MGTLPRQRRPITDADLPLLHRLHAGDSAPFGELYRQTSQELTRYVAARLRDRDRSVVDDLVHDAFCGALADPALLGSLLRLAAWAVNRRDWAQRRSTRAAYCVCHDRTKAAAIEVRTIAGAG